MEQMQTIYSQKVNKSFNISIDLDTNGREIKMNCNEIRELLSLYIDNNLDEEQMLEIEGHLLICGDCNKELEHLNLLINSMKNLPEVNIPTHFDSRLSVELKKSFEMNKKTNKRNMYIRYSSFAAIFVIGIFSIAMYNNINLGELNKTEQLPVSQDAVKMMATPIDEEISEELDQAMNEQASKKEVDQAMNDYIEQLDLLYKDQPYVLLDWIIESPEVYKINIQLETTGAAGDVSYETVVYRGQNGELWKIE